MTSTVAEGSRCEEGAATAGFEGKLEEGGRGGGWVMGGRIRFRRRS
jgi:hypothetical protein